MVAEIVASLDKWEICDKVSPFSAGCEYHCDCDINRDVTKVMGVRLITSIRGVDMASDLAAAAGPAVPSRRDVVAQGHSFYRKQNLE